MKDSNETKNLAILDLVALRVYSLFFQHHLDLDDFRPRSIDSRKRYIQHHFLGFSHDKSPWKFHLSFDKIKSVSVSFKFFLDMLVFLLMSVKCV